MVITRDQTQRQNREGEPPGANVGDENPGPHNRPDPLGAPNPDPQNRQNVINERERALNLRIEDLNRREREFENRIRDQNINNGHGAGIAIPGLEVNRQYNLENNQAIRLPKFCENDPELWFIQVESIFDRLRINTEEARCQIIMSHMDADVLNCVRHIIVIVPRPENCYTQLKMGLISHFSISNETRVFQLIRGDVNNSGKPSQMLSRIRSLNAGNCNDEVLKTIFLSKLPHQHQLLLTTASDLTLNELAMRADRMFEVDKIAIASNAVVSSEPPQPPATDKIEVLATEIAELKTKVEQSNGHKSRDHQRRGNGNYNRGRGRSRPFYRGNNNNYRGRGRSRNHYRSNSHSRNYNSHNNQYQRNPFHGRFRSSSPYGRHHHNGEKSHSSERCYSRQRSSCCNESGSEN